jgi:hypothetical protein
MVDWNPITKEQALASNDFMTIYAASKKYAELSIWEWADKHPDVEMTVRECQLLLFLHSITIFPVNPPLVAGPYCHEFYADLDPKANPNSNPNSQPPSNKLILGFIFPNGTFTPHQNYVDVRDVAKAHVNAVGINFKSSSNSKSGAVERKRIIFSSPHEMDHGAVLKMIARKRPELTSENVGNSEGGRLNNGVPPGVKNPGMLKRLPCDFRRIEEVVGMKVEDFHTLEEVRKLVLNFSGVLTMIDRRSWTSLMTTWSMKRSGKPRVVKLVQV